jgi:hypothetical protein
MAGSAALFAAGVGAAISLKPGTFGILGGAVAAAAAMASTPTIPLAFAAAGWVVGGATRTSRTAPPAQAASLRGSVVSMPRHQDVRARFVLADSSTGRIDVSSPDLASPLALGDKVLLSADLRELRGARNPGGRDPAFAFGAHGLAGQAATRTAPARTAPPSPHSRVAAARIAWGFFIALFIFLTFNDIARIPTLFHMFGR